MSPPVIRRPDQITDTAQYILELEDLVGELWAFREAVIGWRERDWPENFSRTSAEMVATRAAVFEAHRAEATTKKTEKEIEEWTQA